MVSKEVTSETDPQLRDYEMVLVISPELEEERFEATLNNISRFITERGGIISDVERWGKRKLAYPIKHFVDGGYVLTHFKLKPELAKELEASLQISGEVLRHLLIKLDA